MGAPIRTSTSDIPDFSTYPAAPSDHLLTPHAASIRTPTRTDGAALNDVASQVGHRIGAGVSAVRDARERVLGRVHDLRQSAEDLLHNFRGRSADAAQESFDQLRARARIRVDRAKQFAQERPLAVIAAAGIAGILLGAGARAWRGRRG